MGTRKHPEAPGEPCFVTFTTEKRLPVFAQHPAAAMFIEHLLELREELGFLLLAYAVMPDHVHLVLVPREVGLSRIMQVVKGRFARAYNKTRRQSGKLWQARYYETGVRDEAALIRRIAYVEEIPAWPGWRQRRTRILSRRPPQALQ